MFKNIKVTETRSHSSRMSQTFLGERLQKIFVESLFPGSGQVSAALRPQQHQSGAHSGPAPGGSVPISRAQDPSSSSGRRGQNLHRTVRPRPSGCKPESWFLFSGRHQHHNWTPRKPQEQTLQPFTSPEPGGRRVRRTVCLQPEQTQNQRVDDSHAGVQRIGPTASQPCTSSST